MENKHKKDVLDYFSNASNKWQSIYHGEGEGITFRAMEMRWRKEKIIEFLDDFSGEKSIKVLDVGCGIGSIFEDVLKRGHDAIGMDISMDMTKTACQMVADQCEGDTRVVLGDTYDLPFPDEYFDMVLCVGVLQYLKEESQAISEISRVVKHGGMAIITLPNISKINNILDPYYIFYLGPKFIWQKIFRFNKKKSKSVKKINFSLNKDFSNKRYFYRQMDNQFMACNLVDPKTCAIGFGPLTLMRKEIIPLKISEWISEAFQKISMVKGWGFFKFFANRWVIYLQKK
jgi:ubiquinone/menaquinone biosynthesis C-methylase UbiE